MVWYRIRNSHLANGAAVAIIIVPLCHWGTKDLDVVRSALWFYSFFHTNDTSLLLNITLVACGQSTPSHHIFPSVAIGTEGYYRRSIRPSVCPSVFPPSARLLVPDDVTTLFSLKISATRLWFSRMIQGTMEQIAIQVGYARPISACSMGLSNFPRQVWTGSAGRPYRSYNFRISVSALHLVREQVPILTNKIYDNTSFYIRASPVCSTCQIATTSRVHFVLKMAWRPASETPENELKSSLVGSLFKRKLQFEWCPVWLRHSDW